MRNNNMQFEKSQYLTKKHKLRNVRLHNSLTEGLKMEGNSSAGLWQDKTELSDILFLLSRFEDYSRC
jgi:hypothetical protein